MAHTGSACHKLLRGLRSTRETVGVCSCMCVCVCLCVHSSSMTQPGPGLAPQNGTAVAARTHHHRATHGFSPCMNQTFVPWPASGEEELSGVSSPLPARPMITTQQQILTAVVAGLQRRTHTGCPHRLASNRTARDLSRSDRADRCWCPAPCLRCGRFVRPPARLLLLLLLLFLAVVQTDQEITAAIHPFHRGMGWMGGFDGPISGQSGGWTRATKPPIRAQKSSSAPSILPSRLAGGALRFAQPHPSARPTFACRWTRSWQGAHAKL